MPLAIDSLGRSLDDLPLAPILSVLFGLVAAILVLATPAWMLDRIVLASGLPSLAPSATPPLDGTARSLAAFAAMWLVAGVLWPAFALVSAILAPKPQKGKGHRIDASFDLAVPALQFEALIRGPLDNSEKPQPADALRPDTAPGKHEARKKLPVSTKATDTKGMRRGNSETLH